MRIYNLLISLTVSMSAMVILLPSMAISQQINSSNGVWNSDNAQKATDEIILKELQEISDYHNRATLKLESGDGEGALSELDTVINIYPQHSSLYVARGMVHYRLGNKTKAESDFNTATNLEAADKHIKRGDAKYDSGDKKGAIFDYDQAININPKSFVGYISRGTTKYALNDYEGAILDFDKAISIKSKQRASTYGIRGFAKYRLNNKKGAINDLRIAAKLFKIEGDMKSYNDTNNLIRLMPN